ncbi:histone deacetylase [Streptomyces sp. NPDC099050]|uniref:histone deacetylase n=1 Tax=Streptomyces sp. NPDC099050 TaxID=3366100 RepID=UPI0037F44F16
MVVHTAVPLGAEAPPVHRRVWYASYGSNMHMNRLAAYIAGGTPPGAARSHPGCRDRRTPERSIAVQLAGCLYFATESPVWTGGRGFYDPSAPGRLLGRAHLVTVSQLSDIAAQEMYRDPGADLDLSRVLREGRDESGSGRYETLVCPGTVEGIPVLTFTAPWSVGDVEPIVPSAAYLRYLASGLLESGPWAEQEIADYLSACPGAAGHWTPRQVLGLLAEPTDRPAGGLPEARA